jgi:hypothetical protein
MAKKLNELDTSWFDLKNYAALKTMSLEGWIYQLEMRSHFDMELNNRPADPNDESAYMPEIVKELKKGVFDVPSEGNYFHDRHKWRSEAVLNGSSFSTVLVSGLTAGDIWTMVDDDDLSTVWPACKQVSDSRLNNDLDPAMVAVSNTPIDLLIETFPNLAHIVVNLSATDEQIKKDFGFWLEQYREASGYPPHKKLFTQLDFDHWVKFGAIQYLDLMLMAKIEGKKITQNQLANLIFPDEQDVDTVERIRKVTKPTAESLIKSEIHDALSTQLADQNVRGMKNN